jgi:signal transduction histidine kinase
VRADRDLIRQLLANLLGNAVKFARPGSAAHLEISSREDDEPVWIRIDVADRGLGLPAGEEELIFEEFHRATEHAEGVEGTGLGLSLCRTIVARHGGSITAFTNEHGGATFTMTLPIAR